MTEKNLIIALRIIALHVLEDEDNFILATMRLFGRCLPAPFISDLFFPALFDEK